MIPIKLSIQGLYSYQDLQEIDFQRLTGSSVFGIFGKVGSGKTSLLEAISFALYGETERLNSRDNRQYNMMNLKSKHLLIDFEFQAGPDQHIYKFTYEAKRHPKKHHEIGPGERRMFIRQENDWHPIGNEKEDIALLSKQILGLDYENFKRTIIIPQNQFREFLELSPAERTKMMNQLFKLDQYDLAGRVGKLSKANDDQLAELRGLLSPLEDVTPEAITHAEANIASSMDAVRAKEIEIEQLEPNEQRLLQSQTQSQKLATVQRELAGLQTLEISYNQLRQTIALYETCRLVFQADLVALRKLQDKQTGLVDAKSKTTKQLSLAEGQLVSSQSVYEATKKAYEGRGQLQQQIDELDTVQQIRTLQESIELQARNRQQVAARIDRQKNEVDGHKTKRQTYQTLIDNLLGQPSQLERLYQVEKWFAIYKPLKKQADELQKQLMDHETAVEQIKRQKDQALAGFPEDWATFTLKTLPIQIDTALEQLKGIRKDREKVYQQAFVKQELAHFADSLTDGAPCPLCGSEHHPAKHEVIQNKSNADLIRQEVSKSETALNKVNQRIDDTTALRLLIEGLAKDLRSALENSKRLIQERAEVVRQLIEHEDQFVWHEFDKEKGDDLAGAIRQESEQQKQLQHGQKVVRELSKQIEEIDTVLQEDEKKLREFDTAIAGLNGQLKTAVESLAYYRLHEISKWDLRQITDLRDSLTRTYSQTKTNFDEADKQKSEIEKLQATLLEQFQQLANQLADLANDIEAVELTLSQNLTKHAITREVVEQVLQSNLDADQEKQRIREFDKKRAGLEKQITDLELELAKHPFDPVALATVQSQLKVLRDQKDGLNKEFGQLTNVLKNLKEQWTQKQEYQKRYDALDLRKQDLKKMDELFRAQGFVNYVSSVYLKNLCESANDRFFKLTNNQLKLELDEKNNFQVRDYLNGGETRSVKTLSGGQTFQAALSLALALSDNIQHLTKAKQNLFFLDEGFGTLDKDSLQTVFKTLKALRSENRVVGIISHVEELQQEVDTYIRAEASENGSRIKRSWDE
ncbi:AAA family ATPase [Spirosoma sp. HMF4905]|uniref:AAA family ATPase n=1 Tax=Spirosoma arboris TaxID=2682092 RepID=A0A7K1SR65_9BACT|nr:SMC family ATPase [Spirosoma arboris]MVM36305.1 AAA family ATPase [Spirosoma arboris]